MHVFEERFFWGWSSGSVCCVVPVCGTHSAPQKNWAFDMSQSYSFPDYLLLEGTTEDEMKTLHFKINVYHQKYTSNLVICFFHVVVWKIWYLIYWMEYVFMTLILNWIIQAEYLTIAQVSSFYEPPSVNIDCYNAEFLTTNPSLESFSSTEPGLLFVSSCRSWSLIS